MMLLSILIPSLESRRKQLSTLLRELEAQIKPFKDQVEVITLVDNKQATTGSKRQTLLEQAKGKYVVFIDDDDTIYPRYINGILKACYHDKDCIAIDGIMTTDGRNPIKWSISCKYDNKTVKVNNKPYYLRSTNHISPVKRELALQAGFPDKSNGEDKYYSDRLKELGLLKTEAKVEGIIYKYDYSSVNKEYK